MVDFDRNGNTYLEKPLRIIVYIMSQQASTMRNDRSRVRWPNDLSVGVISHGGWDLVIPAYGGGPSSSGVRHEYFVLAQNPSTNSINRISSLPGHNSRFCDTARCECTVNQEECDNDKALQVYATRYNSC